VGISRSVPKISSGVIKFTPDGSHLYSTTWIGQKIERFFFNKEDGRLSRYSYLDHFMPSRIEFSSSGRYLYSLDNAKNIYQFDLISGITDSISLTKTLILNDEGQKIGQLQLALDGRIYFAMFESNFLGVISSPDSKGLLSHPIKNGKSLGKGSSYYALPNFNASYFYTPSIDFAYTEDCWGHMYEFEGRDTFDADVYKWVFEKGSIRDSILTKHCSYTFPDTGKWQVSHIAWNTTRADTATKTLTIRPKWKNDVLGKDKFYCQGQQANVTLKAPDDMHCVHWNGEEPNLDENLGPIVDYDHFHSDTLLVDTAGTYIVKLTNKTFCQAWDTITISEYPTPSKSGISRFKDSIVSNTVAQTYRWYRDGVPQLETDDRRLKPDSNGTWQVQLVSEFGCESELSDSLLVGFASLPSIKATNPLSFKVYPNPSDGNITIAVPKGGDYQVLIYDMTGKLIYNTSQSLSVLFELELKLVSGTYLLTLTDEDGNVGTKQVVVK
jgi:hypothetical protein